MYRWGAQEECDEGWAEEDRECEEEEDEEEVLYKCKKMEKGDMKMMMKCDDMLLLSSGGENKKREKIVIEKYQKTGAAFEFKERQEYFKGQIYALQVNKFWISVMESILGGSSGLVLNESLIELRHFTAEIVLALSLANLPFVRGSVDSKVEGNKMTLSPSANLLVFCKRMAETSTAALEMELVISQKFYDPEDKFLYDDKDPSVYTVKEVREYLTGKVYEARVAFTNVGEASANVKLITQIPQGALPVRQLEFYKISDVAIASMSTSVLTFNFYFPAPGSFGYYPATIMKNNRFVVAAKHQGQLKVTSEFSKDNLVLETLQDILNYGTIEDILNFMQQKNIFNSVLFDIEKVMWIFKSDKANFARALDILRKRFFYYDSAWGYSVYHGCLQSFLELIERKLPEFSYGFQYLKVGSVQVDNFEPLEYDPLINPRAHDISNQKHNILNQSFKETYERFLRYCIEKGRLEEREKIILTAYLVLQDRISDALEKLKKIDEGKVRQDSQLLVQFEYLKAYLSMYTGHPGYEVARELSAKNREFADLSWRKRFREIEKQIKEYDLGRLEKGEAEENSAVVKKSNKQLADRSEYLALELREGFKLAITHKNLDRLTVSFYRLDLEILFSNDPFLEKEIMNFVSVNPNHQVKYKLKKSSDFKTHQIEIPQPLQSVALFIQVKGKDKFEILKCFNSHLKTHAIEDFGLLNVSDSKGKCLNSVYVKCFSKTKAGVVKFYKDGYTDFRGSFDYASLNSDSMNDIEKFGLFVYSKDHGAVILTAKPPSQIGRIVEADTDEDGEKIQEESDDDEGYVQLE
jgi:hypothetical protein